MDADWSAENNAPIFAKAKYAVSVGGEVFYIDVRNCAIEGDIWIKYDYSTNEVFYSFKPINLQEEWQPVNGIINYWENSYHPPRDISCFNPIPTDLNISNQNGHPYVSWNHDGLTGGNYSFEVYRQLTTSSTPGSNWTLITTTTNKYFLDQDITIGSSNFKAYYRVRAKFDDIYSGYSNYNYITYVFLKESKQHSEIVTDNSLYENYPNPFNPTTKIKYSILNPSTVSLKVYDSFGREVATLVDETKPEGFYETEFDASNLSSGIYFYQLKNNNFVDTKKMMLIK